MDLKHNLIENRIYSMTQNSDLKRFVTGNIKALECIRPVPKELETKLCCCGRAISSHNYQDDQGDRKWNQKDDLKEIPTNAFGEMKLSGFRIVAGVHLKYIRASPSDNLCADLHKLMTKYWDIRKPELIISINGGAKKMIPLNNEQKSAFKRGLINVAKSASTWIITGGFNFGVSKLAGEAAKDYNIASQDKAFIVLGIGTWGAVYNRHDLVLKDDTQKIVYNNAEGQFNLKGQAPLDPNHDAFILYDCGIEGAFGKEIQFRAEFEMFVSKKAKCSVVQVIVEGGKKCIETADEALKQGIPVVVMKGSKRAADLICDVVESDDYSTQDIINDGLSRYKDEWSVTTEAEMASLKKHLISLHDFKKKNLVHIFSMSDFTKNLDRAILEAAFSSQIDGELSDNEKLKLAMAFNRSDVAEDILESSTSKAAFSDYGEFIKIALVKNQWRFVNMFLSRGTQVESFLTKRLLEDLYFGKEANKYINPNVQNILGFLKDRVRSKKQNTIEIIGLIVKRLTKNLIHNLYTKPNHSVGCCGSTDTDKDDVVETEKVTDYDKFMEPTFVRKKAKGPKGYCASCCTSEYKEVEYVYTQYPTVNKARQRIYTEQDLFIWALLTQRWELAKIFWENGKDHIGSALIACVICNSLSKIANKEGEIDMAMVMTNMQVDFENLAMNILSEAYSRDKTRTHLLLIRALPYWGRVTCMEVANKCHLVNFLSQSACQTRLNAIWLGGMSMYTSTALFLLNLPFAFLTSKLFIFGRKRTEEYNEQSQRNSEIEDSVETEFFDKTITTVKDKPAKSGAKVKGVTNESYLDKFRRRQLIAWQNVSFCQAVSYYYRAPITKFTMHIISYLLFLAIYSYVCLVELLPLSGVSTIDGRQMEYAVYTYMLSFVLEEIRQSVASGQFDTFGERLSDWASSWWNIYDLFAYLVFLTGLILRYITSIDFVYARTVFSVALSLFYLRFLQFYYANRSLGPKVISVSKMIKDILFFLALYVIAIFAYGTFAQALLFSNSPINSFLLKNIVYMPFWQSYGDLHIDYVEGTAPVNNVSATPNAMVIVAFAIFILFTNALLMNMLVAMFGMTFEKVEDNAYKTWAFNRYNLIEEFYYRPILPPPLNVFEIIYMAFKAMRCGKINKGQLKINDFAVNLTHDEDLRSAGFEQQCLEVYLLENPLLKSSNESDSSSQSAAITTEGGSKEASSTNFESFEHTEKILSSVMETINEIKLEMKNVAAQVHKVRRHQKRDPSLSRTPVVSRDQIKPTPIQSVLPLDNDDDN